MILQILSFLTTLSYSQSQSIKAEQYSQCKQCIGNDFQNFDECHKTGFIQTNRNSIARFCIPENNKDFLDGIRLSAILFLLCLLFTIVAFWRRKVLQSQ